MNRYGSSSEEFEPGSEGRVLRNRRGITDSVEIGRSEARLLAEAQNRAYGELEPTTPLTVALIRGLHRSWLASLYGFAGELRTVDLSKGFVRFAPVAYLETTLAQLGRILGEETPCAGMGFDRLTGAIAKVHAEFVLAHPFQEGNGRLARWVADLMAAQAGQSALDWGFDGDTETNRERYFAALRRGFAGELSSLEALVWEAMVRSSEPRGQDSGKDPRR